MVFNQRENTNFAHDKGLVDEIRYKFNYKDVTVTSNKLKFGIDREYNKSWRLNVLVTTR